MGEGWDYNGETGILVAPKTSKFIYQGSLLKQNMYYVLSRLIKRSI